MEQVKLVFKPPSFQFPKAFLITELFGYLRIFQFPGNGFGFGKSHVHCKTDFNPILAAPVPEFLLEVLAGFKALENSFHPPYLLYLNI